MIIDKKKLLQDRLESKNLDKLFQKRIEHGMGCSPFVSEAICSIVKQVYFPVLNAPEHLRPGQMLFTCLSESNGPGVPIKQAHQITVTLTIDAGEEDLSIRQKHGIDALRRHRIFRLCTEAYNQGGLLTVEDLAYRILNAGERTLHRDLSIMRQKQQCPPLRSTIKDIGRTITHRSLLIKHWLLGDELSDLQRKYNHSLPAIENYIDTFKRVLVLQVQNHSIEQIAYLLRISRSLVTAYCTLWEQLKSKALPHRKREIMELTLTARKKTKSRRLES